MNGHPAMQILALWAGGDLDESVASEVCLHLKSCAECRGSAEEIRSLQELLRGVFGEPSEADLLQVRAGLTRRLARRRTARWCWSTASAAAALALVLAGVTHRSAPVAVVAERTIQLPPFPMSMHMALQIPEMKPVVQVRAGRSQTEQPAGLRAVNFVPGTNGSMQLRLTTADPNVIILLPPPTERTVEQ